MDWLPRLSVGGAMAGVAGKAAGQHGPDSAGKLNGGCQALRKAPNSPLDTNATLDSNEAQHHQQKDGKPPYSYANLITFAINSSHQKKMTLSEIYSWICENFPYYKEAGNGWKVRFLIFTCETDVLSAHIHHKLRAYLHVGLLLQICMQSTEF